MSRAPCGEIAQMLWQFMDHELDVVTTRRLAEHIRECHGCGPRHEFEIRLRAIIQHKCAAAPAPESLRRRVLALLREI